MFVIQDLKDKMLHEQKYGPSGQDPPRKAPAELVNLDSEKTWFDRYLKLVDGLYKNDVDHNGELLTLSYLYCRVVLEPVQ